MTTVLRIVFRTVLALLLLVACTAAAGIGYLYLALPHVAPPRDFHARRTPDLVSRGAYLCHHVVGCTDCHGERDWSKYSAPQMRSREGQGGMTFRFDIGTLRAPNITPARLGSWTDGEILRAMTDGVAQDGSPCFR